MQGAAGELLPVLEDSGAPTKKVSAALRHNWWRRRSISTARVRKEWAWDESEVTLESEQKGKPNKAAERGDSSSQADPTEKWAEISSQIP